MSEKKLEDIKNRIIDGSDYHEHFEGLLNKSKTIYTHSDAAYIVELFENVLDEYDITLPSDEDDEREPENTARLYGSTYWSLLEQVEWKLIDILEKHDKDTYVVTDVYGDGGF